MAQVKGSNNWAYWSSDADVSWLYKGWQRIIWGNDETATVMFHWPGNSESHWSTNPDSWNEAKGNRHGQRAMQLTLAKIPKTMELAQIMYTRFAWVTA